MNFKELSERTGINLFESEHKIFSQNGEDGVIAYIVNTLGLDVNNLSFIEFGIEYGTEGNTVLIADTTDSRGLFIEGDPNKFARCEKKYANKDNITVLNDFVFPENINQLINDFVGERELDILSIDVDSIDYYIWEAVQKEVKLLIIEYNSILPEGKKLVTKNKSWNHDDNYGASIEALRYLSATKGYSLIYTDKRGVNAFFINNKYLHLFPESSNNLVINGKMPRRHGKLDLTQFDEL